MTEEFSTNSNTRPRKIKIYGEMIRKIDPPKIEILTFSDVVWISSQGLILLLKYDEEKNLDLKSLKFLLIKIAH